jgi:hypothetical protein
MSYETLREGWIEWNRPAWIRLGSESSLQQCTVKDLSDAAANLEIDRRTQVPDRFVLRLTESGSLALECVVVSREARAIRVNYRLI